MIDDSIQSTLDEPSQAAHPPTITITEPEPEAEGESEDFYGSEQTSNIDVDGELLALIEEPTETSSSTPTVFAAPPVREAAKKSGKALGKIPTNTTVKSAPNVNLFYVFVFGLVTHIGLRNEAKPVPRLEPHKLEEELEPASVVAQHPSRTLRRNHPFLLKHKRIGLDLCYNLNQLLPKSHRMILLHHPIIAYIAFARAVMMMIAL
jgi:hypothetical protein